MSEPVTDFDPFDPYAPNAVMRMTMDGGGVMCGTDVAEDGDGDAMVFALPGVEQDADRYPPDSIFRDRDRVGEALLDRVESGDLDAAEALKLSEGISYPAAHDAQRSGD
jgi:hypothetical protein